MTGAVVGPSGLYMSRLSSHSACMVCKAQTPQVRRHFFAQGSCTKENCPYLHRKIDLGAPVCRAFVEGVCLRGALCPHKHLTARMVKELRASRSLVTASEPSVPIPFCHALLSPHIALLLTCQLEFSGCTSGSFPLHALIELPILFCAARTFL